MLTTSAPPVEIEGLSPQQPEGYGSVLQNRNFLLLWIGQIFSQLGDRVVFVVFISLIVQYFGSGDRYTSFLYIAFTIPAILLTAIAGVFVDRWPRRAVLVSTNILRALFVATLPWFAAGNPWSIYVLAFCLSSATQFFVPAEAATIPMLLRKTQLIAANSLFTTTMMASVIFGFALGDPLINLFSLTNVHWAIVAFFGLASLFLMGVRPPDICSIEAHQEDLQNPTHSPSQGLRDSYRKFVTEMRDGISYIIANPLILQAMLKLAVLFSAVVALCILFVSFAKAYLYDDPQVAARKFAYIITFSGIGMVFGALLVGRFFKSAPRGYMIFGGFSVIGFCLLLLGFTGNLDATSMIYTSPTIQLTQRMLYTYSLVSVMGIGASFIAIPLQALLHELIPEDKRGKILGVQFTILSTCSTLPVLIVGLVSEQVGIQPMLLSIALPLLILGLYGLYKRIQHADDAPANW